MHDQDDGSFAPRRALAAVVVLGSSEQARRRAIQQAGGVMTAVGTRHGGSRARAGDEIGTRTTMPPTRDQTMTRSRLGASAHCRRCIRARTSKRGDGRCSRHSGVMMPLNTRRRAWHGACGCRQHGRRAPDQIGGVRSNNDSRATRRSLAPVAVLGSSEQNRRWAMQYKAQRHDDAGWYEARQLSRTGERRDSVHARRGRRRTVTKRRARGSARARRRRYVGLD